MALVHDPPETQSWLVRAVTTDFCPWANRFIYWLKEPIGWFVLAIVASMIVGMYANPVGWTIAGALTCIILIGIIWPLIAVWTSSCELHPEVDAVHEDKSCRMIFSMRNRLPLPLWGLAVEGYLDSEGDESLPVIALSHVPPICIAEYAITVRPALRGHYPIQTPKVACSFPFGIWTARRELRSVKSLTVWPRVYDIAGVCLLTGKRTTELGDGHRGGRSGDFVGVRGFRRGDSPRHINWAQSARTETLIVTERGGPQCIEIDLNVDPMLGKGQSRTSLAIRMRVAASILCSLHGSHAPTRVSIGEKAIRQAVGCLGRRQLMDALADIPVDGCDVTSVPRIDTRRIRIEIGGDHSGHIADVEVTVIDPNAASRAGGTTRRITIRCDKPLDEQLIHFWQELGNVPNAA
ncbi:MAG: DUF58 domain-containing protein [Rubripirellula sp.]